MLAFCSINPETQHHTKFLRREISLQKVKSQRTCSDFSVKVTPHPTGPPPTCPGASQLPHH